jgi:GH25 family lysozyme M1 (1,4-beta-N-acetylmuramidase)
MSYTPGLDVSRWQGNINFGAVVGAGYQVAVVKISGGDAGLYYDGKASANYYGFKAAGIPGIGGYHFAGGGDPIAEADFFIAGMRPWVENDVWVLDWEIQHPDPVGWCGAFLQRCHDVAGVWPLLYMNGSTRNAYNWDSNGAVANCGKWIAWYGRDPEGTLPVAGVYIMHQYTSSGSVPGIAGNVDLDAVYMDIGHWDMYGWHPAAPAPPVITTQDVTTTNPVPFNKVTVNDDTKPVGFNEITQQGVLGVETVVTRLTFTDGNQTDSQVISDTVTTPPVDEVTTVGTKQPDPTPPPTPDPTPEPTPAPNLLQELINAIVKWLKERFKW